MKKRRGGRGGEKKTKWQQHDVETKRKSEQNIYKGWVLSLSFNEYNITPYMSTCRQYTACNTSTTKSIISLKLWPQESERLEMMNSELKAQIEELKHERQQLILMLNRHRPTCIVRTDSVKTPESEANPLLEQLEAK